MSENECRRLDPEDEDELWRRCADGDADAREALIVAYRPLVFWIAGKIRSYPSVRQDIVQEGMLALIQSVDRFDASLGFRFPTYAYHRIRGRMINLIERVESRAPLPMPDEDLEAGAIDYRDDDWLDVEESVSRLRGREAAVVSALFFEGKAPCDVAREQSIDVSHVYRLKRRAIARIRGWLGLPAGAGA